MFEILNSFVARSGKSWLWDGTRLILSIGMTLLVFYVLNRLGMLYVLDVHMQINSILTLSRCTRYFNLRWKDSGY